jgi:hypothetical protein
MKRWLLFGSLVFLWFSLKGQISPPALSNTNTSAWAAFAIRQSFDSLSQKQSITYIGKGTMSHPTNGNPFEKQGILVINEEFFHQFRPNWQYSVALSYRRQHEYTDLPPYGPDLPPLRQEMRLYGRFTYLWKGRRLRFAATVREDFRKFFTPDFHHWDETFQLRSRLRTQLGLQLDREKIHRLSLSAEALFATSYFLSTRSWSPFSYREMRLCLYYSIDPADFPLTFNFGYMNNLVGRRFHTAHYLAMDIIWENPFGNL